MAHEMHFFCGSFKDSSGYIMLYPVFLVQYGIIRQNFEPFGYKCGRNSRQLYYDMICVLCHYAESNVAETCRIV